MIPDDWKWRELVRLAIGDAQRRQGGITQNELAHLLGVGRELMLFSRNTTPYGSYDYPRPGMGLIKSCELAELAGWSEKQVYELVVAWIQEAMWRAHRQHFLTIQMLPAGKCRRRWEELAGLAREAGKVVP